MSREPKQLTKKQLIDKMHEERRMWMDRVEQTKIQTRDATLASARQILDTVTSMLVRAFGGMDGDSLRLDVNIVPDRDGYHWETKIEVIDESTWRLWAKEMEDGSTEEEG